MTWHEKSSKRAKAAKMHQSSTAGYYSVSALLTELTQRLEGQWGDVWVAGEISNFRLPSSGHLYFSLKDEKGHLRAVMFRNYALYLGFRPQDGIQVLARGTVTGMISSLNLSDCIAAQAF